MRSQLKIILLLLPTALVGCQSPKLSAPDIPDSVASKVAKVVVYRESFPEIGQGDLYFGEGGRSYAVFSEIGSKEISLPPGKHVFELTSNGAATFTLEVALAPNSSTCIRARTNGANAYGKYIFPLLRNLTSEFQAEVFPCPEKPKQADDLTS